jgi:hypothetical protein
MTIIVPEGETLNFGDIRAELDTLLEAVSNTLEREWPHGYGAVDSPAIVIGHYRVCLIAFKTLRYFCADTPAVEPNRWPEFVVSAPPLVRSMLDALANIVYIFENLAARTVELAKRGWKEDHERAERYRARYGNDAAWTAYFAELAAEEPRVRELLAIEHAEMQQLRRWPSLGKMISATDRDRLGDDSRREFLTYLNDLFYREFSEDAHLSPPGLYRRSDVLLVERRLWTNRQREAVADKRTHALMTAMGLMFAISAEFSHDLRLGLNERIVRLWTRVNFYSSILKELYEQRYSTLLVAP